MAFYQFRAQQTIPASPADVWEFISSPRNLKRITPPHMGFDILTPALPEKMYEGLVIAYTVRPLAGIPMTWVTEITHIRDMSYFVDEQRMGPYALWHHEHHIRPADGGTLMEDIISYAPPFGVLGALVHPFLIRPQLEKIFAFRGKALAQIFGT